MAGLPSPNRIKTHRIYTVWEAAVALRRHKQTIIRWIRFDGLIAETGQRPWLIKGADLKTYLGYRQKKNRCKLAPHQLYCLGCREPREPAGKFADYVQTSATSGMLSALCPECSSIINKVIRRSDLEAIRAKIEVTIQRAAPGIVSLNDAPVNVTTSSTEKTNVKTQFK